MIRSVAITIALLAASLGAEEWVEVDLSGAGVGTNHVTALEVDSTGRLWVGFEDGGLAVFDGQTWENFTPVVSYPPAIEAISVSDRTIWMANRRDEIWRWRNGQWQTYEGTLGARTHWAREVPDEELLQGIDCYRRDITRIDGDGVVNGVPFADRAVLDLLATPEGDLWIGMGSSFAVLLLSNDAVNCWNLPHLRETSGSTLGRTLDGTVWLRSSRDHVMRYDGSWSSISAPFEVVGLSSSPDGAVYLYGLGVWRFDGSKFEGIVDQADAYIFDFFPVSDSEVWFIDVSQSDNQKAVGVWDGESVRHIEFPGDKGGLRRDSTLAKVPGVGLFVGDATGLYRLTGTTTTVGSSTWSGVKKRHVPGPR